MHRTITASIAEASSRWVALALLTACGPSGLDPGGLWEGRYTLDDGTRRELTVEVGEEQEYPTLHAFESARWRVYEASGHVDTWFDFQGLFLHCVDGPCRIDLYLGMGGGPEDWPLVEQGGFYVLGRPWSRDEPCTPTEYQLNNVHLHMSAIQREGRKVGAEGDASMGCGFGCVRCERGPAAVDFDRG